MYTLFQLFIVFFKVGLFTIGGGYAMIPLIQQEVMAKDWCTLPELLDYMAVAQSTPGAFAVNTATFIGMRTAGIAGVLVSVFALVLPSFVILLVIAMFFKNFKDLKLTRGMMAGLHPAVIGLMITAIITVTLPALNIVIDTTAHISQWFRDFNFVTLIVLAIILVIWRTTKLHPILLIVIGGFLGVGFNYLGELIFI